MIDIRQSVQYANYLENDGWIVERVENVNYFIRKFSIFGSILKLQRPEKVDFDKIEELCRKYRVFQIILEPKNESQTKSLASNGIKLSKSPYLPSKTLQIDLTQSEKTIFRNLKKDARGALRKGSDRAIKTYSTDTEIQKWRDAWRSAVKFDRYVPSYGSLINLRKSFSGNKSLFLASHNITGSIIGGALFTNVSHGVAYYWYGFTNSEGRSSLSQYSLLYHGILWAKKQGCKVFDFEGIYDPRFPNKSWLGFTHFKKSFGGREVLYPGAYSKTNLFPALF
jgi:hypothetical protein